MNVPLRGALYLRVSTARQAEHDVSNPDQKRQGEPMAARAATAASISARSPNGSESQTERSVIGSKGNLLQTLTAAPGVRSSVLKWRMGWDSNPRYRCRYSALPTQCLKPLGHPSIPESWDAFARPPLPRLWRRRS
jgi:hypothetical protein